jgi:Ca2+-binding EF-hand superfamily protein
MASIIRKPLPSPRHVIGPFATVLLLSLIIPTASAEGASAAVPSAGDAALFDRLDVDHNGTITADEVTPENRSLFNRLLRHGDANHDQALSRVEFLAALVPSRPEKPMEAKEPTTLPGANAVRYLLLTMDTNRNARIEKDEVPKNLKPAFEAMVERMDRNANGSLERQELSRGGPAMSAVAARFVNRLGINVDAELAKLEKSQGADANRFDQQPMPLESLRDPKQARRLFAQLDENGDGKLAPQEVPEPLRQPITRLVRIADRNGDGKLTQEEFLTGTEQIAKFLNRRQAEPTPPSSSTPNRKSKPGKPVSDKK